MTLIHELVTRIVRRLLDAFQPGTGSGFPETVSFHKEVDTGGESEEREGEQHKLRIER